MKHINKKLVLSMMTQIFALVFTAQTYGTCYNWNVNGDPNGGSISHPVNSGVYLCGADVQFMCSRASDDDERCPKDGGSWEPVADSMSSNHPRWTATAGSFKDGDDRGTIVYWIAPDSETSNITVRMYEDDLPNAIGGCDSGTRNDSEKKQDEKTGIETIIPELNTVQYGGGNHTIDDVTVPEFDRTAGRDDPAAWTIDSDATATVTFWYSENLSQAAVDVTVRAETSGDNWNIGDWGNNTGNTFGTTWPTGSMTCTSEWDIDPDVQWQDYTANWRYKCPYGSNNWIDTVANPDQSTTLYVVWDTPDSSLDYSKAVYKRSCTYCWGCDKSLLDPEDEEDICDEVLDGIAGDYTYNGTCAYDSSNFVRLIGVQGVSGTLHKWETNATGDGDINWMQTISIDLIGTDPNWPTGRTSWSNFHQWATAAGYNWDASSEGKLAGGWGDYEDWLFNNGGTDDYGVQGGAPIANPAGQAAGDHPGMTHTTPAPLGFTEP